MDLRSGCAYWLLSNGLLASYPRLTRDESVDIAIIGAGITGAAAAYRLARAGAHVVVVDRREAVHGSSAASTGLLLYDTDTSLTELAARVGLARGVRVYQLGRDAIDDIEAVIGELGDDCGFARRSCVYLASDPHDVGRFANEQALRRANGFECAVLGPTSLESRFGLHARAAICTPNAAEVDCFRLTHRLLAAAVRQGAEVYDRTRVSTVRRRPGGLELRTEDGVRIRARRVVWAGGYETTEWLQRRVSVLHSTWACATEPIEASCRLHERCLVWETARPYVYLRTTGDGRILIGGEDSRSPRRHASERMLRRKTATLMAQLDRLIPGLDAEPAYSWAGVFAETRDGLPYIGPYGDPDIWYTLGYAGNGITFAMIAADIVCNAWLGKPNPDAQLFGFDR